MPKHALLLLVVAIVFIDLFIFLLHLNMHRRVALRASGVRVPQCLFCYIRRKQMDKKKNISYSAHSQEVCVYGEGREGVRGVRGRGEEMGTGAL